MLLLILIAGVGGAVAGYWFHDQIAAYINQIKNIL